MTTTVVFGVSLFIAVLIVMLKHLELRSSKRHFLLSPLSKFDNQVQKLMRAAENLMLTLLKSLQHLIMISLKNAINKSWLHTKNRILHEYRIREEIILGRKHIPNRGSVSFYLRKIDEAKNGNKGEIN